MTKKTLDREKPPLHIVIYSRCYGFLMRVLHAFGGHWHGKPTGPNRDILWCHWCGNRKPWRGK